MSPLRAQPHYFGSPDHPLFGWMHMPADTATCRTALVLCNPFGFEEVCAHRSLMHLAEAVASAGIPCLRFDYLGCGNSSSDVGEGDALEAWKASTHMAVERIKQVTGVGQVCLFGLRLGAMVATLVAQERDDMRGLILVAPVVRGRAYLRELTLLERSRGHEVPDGPDGDFESAGFMLSPATRLTLARTDLRQMARAPAPDVLVVPRDDMPEETDWQTSLRTLEAGVQVVDWPGYAAMVDDPQRARTPWAVVEGIQATLIRWQTTLPAIHLPAQAAFELVMNCAPAGQPGPAAWTETVEEVNLADQGRLFAVVCRPQGSGSPAASGRVSVLMLNSGSVHSIGPNRLWVRLSRRWASLGLTVVRMDLSGIGDSPPRPGAADNVVYSPSALADVSAALDHVRTSTGAGQCLVVGLCSGAYHAFKSAVAGFPVSAALMINPLTYFWNEGATVSDLSDYTVLEQSARYRAKVLTLDPWRRLLAGQLDLRTILEIGLRRAAHALYPSLREIARMLGVRLRRDLAAELRAARRNGTRLRFVFGDEATGYSLLEREAGRALRSIVRDPEVSIDFVSDSDHTFTRAAARERLVTLLDRLVIAAAEAAPKPMQT